MDNHWVERLKQELWKPLPGVEAQMRLSPPVRPAVEYNHPMRESAVLILLFPVGSKIFTVFNKRSEYDGVHSGQIGLPGGMYKESDSDLKNTALRETMEEIGISEDQIEIIGSLSSLHIPISQIKVYPFVGICSRHPKFNPDPLEVKYVIETALDELLNTSNQKFKNIRIGDNEIEIPYFDIRDEHIWGATAMIISEFIEVVKRI